MPWRKGQRLGPRQPAVEECLSVYLPLNQNQFALYFTRYFRAAVARQHVDFTADAIFRQINSGLNGEAGIGDDFALVLGLQVIHIGAVAVDVLANGVPCAMNKEVTVSG